MRRLIRTWIPVAVVPAFLFALWVFAGAAHWFSSYQLATPVQVVHELISLWQRGLLQRDIGISLVRVFSGFGIALVLAVVIGTLVGLNRTVESMLDPTLQAARSVPSLAWVPLLLLWLGIGETAKVSLVAIGAFFPIYVNLVSGIHGVDRKLVEVGRVLGLTPAALATRIVLPAALPSLLVGARIGLTQAWLFLVAAELLASTSGLGFLLSEGQQISRPDEILASILLLATLGKACESFMRVIERRTTSWTDGLR